MARFAQRSDIYRIDSMLQHGQPASYRGFVITFDWANGYEGESLDQTVYDFDSLSGLLRKIDNIVLH